jgi:hypothetical protein
VSPVPLGPLWSVKQFQSQNHTGAVWDWKHDVVHHSLLGSLDRHPRTDAVFKGQL